MKSYYYELDRVTLVDYPGTDLDISYTYDDLLVPFSLGRLTQIGRASGNVDYQYDRFGRVTQDGELAYNHDANGNRTTITYPGGLVAAYTFDHADRDVSLTAQPSGGSVQGIASAATYAALGPLTSLTLGNGLTEDRVWTSRYFPQSIELSGAGGTLLRWNYGTDAEGNITGITNPNNAGDNRSFGYQDVQYYLTSGTGPWGALSWSYDQIGNRLTETRDGLTDTYSYVQNAGSNNTAILQQIQLGIGGQRTYQHGPAGHMTQIDSAGNVTDLAYDDAGRLSQLLKPATNEKTDFLYDGRSYLVSSEAGVVDGLFFDDFELGVLDCWDSKEEDGVVTVLGKDCQTLVTVPTYSSEGVLHALDKVDGRASVDEVEYFLYFAGRPVAQVTVSSAGAAEFEWITTDHLGTPAVVTDAAGVEVWGGGFEPFGRDFSMAAGTSLRLPGQFIDSTWSSMETGLAQNLHRWYLSQNGRYSVVDPWGWDAIGEESLLRQSSQGVLPAVLLFSPELGWPYLYALNSPLVNRDASGQSAVAVVLPFAPICLADSPLPGPADAFFLSVLMTAHVIDSVLRPSSMPSQCDDCEDKGKWTCIATCNLVVFDPQPGIPYPNPPRMQAMGRGATRQAACKAAEARARNSTPRGSRTRHCKCKPNDCWRG